MYRIIHASKFVQHIFGVVHHNAANIRIIFKTACIPFAYYHGFVPSFYPPACQFIFLSTFFLPFLSFVRYQSILLFVCSFIRYLNFVWLLLFWLQICLHRVCVELYKGRPISWVNTDKRPNKMITKLFIFTSNEKIVIKCVRSNKHHRDDNNNNSNNFGSSNNNKITKMTKKCY